jgi:Putative auto-transporter adhesin, head GIN domain
MSWSEIEVQVSCSQWVLRGAAALGLLAMLPGCSKENEAGCFTSTGNIVTERRSLPPFQVLSAYDNVQVTLVQDSETYAEVRAGKNLQDDIRLEVKDDQLIIRNTSRCNWVRRYDTPREVTLHVPRLTSIFLRGQADIRTQGIFSQDTIFCHLVGAGDFRLNLASNYIGMSQYELGDIYLKGTSQELHHTLGGSGSLYASDFPLQDVYLQTNASSSGNVRLRVGQLLAGTHAGAGTVFYGLQPRLEMKVTGKGKLVVE